MSYRLVVQGPGAGSEILRAIRHTSMANEFDRLTGFYAYATIGGTRLVLETLRENLPRWKQAQKRWLVSMDFGRTDPDALELLASIPRSDVRIPNAQEVLNQRLRPTVCFHAKTLIFDTRANPYRAPSGLVVGSANLSVSGLTLGQEHAIAASISRRPTRMESVKWRSIFHSPALLEDLFRSGTRLTNALLRRYTALRPERDRFQDDRQPIIRNVIQAQNLDSSFSEAVTLATAGNLWVDVDYVVQNRGRDLPGNQVDLARGTRTFFGLRSERVERNTFLGNVGVRFAGLYSDCHMRFGNNMMDKLNLPIPGDGGPPRYENTTLLFKRGADGTFILEVRNREDADEWRVLSESNGSLFRMRSGREYGVFS